MPKMKSSDYTACLLASSIVLNLFLVGNLYAVGWWKKVGWSQRASAEAEAVASVSCSGHGRAYVDGLRVNGKPVCECNTCFGGLDCSEFLPDCPADADSGDPLFLEPFWMQHAASSATVVAGWHRMSYVFSDDTNISQELEKRIRKVHGIAKNAVTDGKYILFGSGSTQLLIAAVQALSMDNSSSPAKVVVSAPYYPFYKAQTNFFQTVDFEFVGDASLWKNSSDASLNIIEFVTSPNNPDGLLRKAVLQGPSVKAINDHAYYWPHFTAIPAPADEDVMIFTISKLTGHAGSRFGWALIKDEAVYQRMTQYVEMAQMGISRDAQLRAFKLLEVVLQQDGKEIFEFTYRTMRNRWENLTQTLSMSTRFSLQKIPPLYCTYFQKVREPSPAYAWLKCEREEDTDCNAVLRSANIIGREGSLFGTGSHYARLSLLKSQDDFDMLLQQIMKLVAEEDGAQSM